MYVDIDKSNVISIMNISIDDAEMICEAICQYLEGHSSNEIMSESEKRLIHLKKELDKHIPG